MDISFLQWGSLALLIPFWRQAITLLNRFRALFITRDTITGTAAFLVQGEINTNWTRLSVSDRVFTMFTAYHVKREETVAVSVQTLGAMPAVYKQGSTFILVGARKSRPKDSMAPANMGDNGEVDNTVLIITYIRGTFNTCTILQKIQDEQDTKLRERVRSDRFYITHLTGPGGSGKDNDNDKIEEGLSTPASSDLVSLPGDMRRSRYATLLGYDWGEIGENVRKSAYENYAFEPEVKEFVEDLAAWINGEGWFKDHGVPWRRGWLLTSDPGGGKSSLVSAVAQKYGVPIMSFDLATHTNVSFSRAWDRCVNNKPCIVLLEDFDACFNLRENTTGIPGGLSFDCLLNCISGVSDADGVFLVITTNHLDKIDPAIGVPNDKGESTRPGRIDRVLRVPNLREHSRRQIALRVLSDWPELVDQVVAETEGYTGARVLEKCTSLALKKYWEEGRKDKCSA